MSDSATLALVKESGPASGEMLFALLDQSQDCIKVIEPDGSLGFMNRNGRCIMEVDDFCAIAGKQWTDLWPDEARHLIDHAMAEARAGRGSRFEAYCPTAKGTGKHWDVAVSPVLDPAGELYAIMSISRDVSERVATREKLRELAVEMRHRLRNAYAVAGAIALQSARGHDDRRAFAGDLANRFALVAQSQSRLLDADARPWRLTELIEMIVGSHNQDMTRVDITGLPDTAVDSGAALLVALVFGELTTNSLKHGALGGDQRITLSAAQSGDAGDARLRLVWDEPTDRAAAPAEEDGHGSGLGMMQRMARAHRASFTNQWLPGRLVATLDVAIGAAGDEQAQPGGD